MSRPTWNAALDSGGGPPQGRRHRHQEFLELLQALRRRWPRGRLLVINYNLSIHWFSLLERQWLKRASLRTFGAMAARIGRLIAHWNRTARPFRWTFKGYPLRR